MYKKDIKDIVVALAGNPNVGKSTIFNCLTGLNQHTGNWPGKTVSVAKGTYNYQNKNFILIDLPGTYSLMANSTEEEVARDFICFLNPNVTVVVVDATCLERNLILVLQTLEITSNVILCVNLMDEAIRKGIEIDLNKLSNILGIPVIGTSATKKKGINKLIKTINEISNEEINPIKIEYEKEIEEEINVIKEKIPSNYNQRWLALKIIEGDKKILKSIKDYLNITINYDVDNESSIRDKIITKVVNTAENISKEVITINNKKYKDIDRKIDSVLTSKIFGIPIMLLLLAFIFFLTIKGANIPSTLLANGLFWIEEKLTKFFLFLNTPEWIYKLFVLGIYRTVAWVISVMLPPMAIFFPFFTMLEDLGYLPRIAFNLDKLFKKAYACGKQALTMCMGFGCNACGVIGCRIIDSPRERLIAIITNNFVPCNGRFPTLIAIISMFFISSPFVSTFILILVILLGIFMTLLISKILSKTILKGIPSTFTLELPPYRKPQIGKIIVRSIFDKTLFVLGRAILVAAPAGLIIWLLANISIGNNSVLYHCANFLDPVASIIGLDGYILMAFILGLPANEIVIPIVIMSYMATGNMIELNSLTELKTLLINNGWTWLTAVCFMLFSLMHWPCGTTCLTIKKETNSWKWTLVSFLVPTIAGFSICFIVSTICRLLFNT